MFLHIGGSRIVFHKDIIGIFNLKLRDNPTNKQFLESVPATRFLDSSEYARYNSFLITDETVHLSPIAPPTLARRKNKS